jgi:tetrapyrrole methylase family protein / MazG family protein
MNDENRAAAASATAAEKAFGRLYSIVARLRAPDGCPWDREQSPNSLRGSVVEEAYELVEAIDEGDAAHVAEEAGDLFLLATMIPYMYEERGSFSVAEAAAALFSSFMG